MDNHQSGHHFPLLPAPEGVSSCCAYKPKGYGGEVWGKPDHHQPSRTGDEPEHHTGQFYLASACGRAGTAFARTVARTAHAPDGIETDKQVHTQTGKEE